MDGETDWIAARFLLSTILGVHPLVVLLDDAAPRDGDDETFLDDGDGGASTVAVMPAAVEAPEELVAGAAVCAVCTEAVAAGQAVARLPCAHWYHHACIAPWLRIRATCPTCRAELPRELTGDGRRPEAETTGGWLRREASYTMLAVAGTLPS
ncbi:hypothetical protein ACP4OV_016640 [Aristida adscensionis]